MARKKPKKTSRRRKPLDSSLPIYRLKISLEDIEPPIWRRLETCDCSLDDLHELIQASFDWESFHPHAFEIQGHEYAATSEFGTSEFEDAAEVFLSDLIENRCYEFHYEYDFGDSWIHRIEIEDTLPAEEGVRYPRCLDGKRAAPPEDSGGPYQYPYLLQAFADPENAADPDILDWIAPDFDPERFDLDNLNKMLLRMRSYLGRNRGRNVPAAGFEEGDLVRVKTGVVHSVYDDIPLGGWTGIVLSVNYLIPTVYEVQWTESTLASVHEVFFKRCQRDDAPPDEYSLDEWEIEAAAESDPLQIEQPAEIRTRPLSPDDQEDRIRMVFGLTSDDPLPSSSPETEQAYFEHLRDHLQFPIKAKYWCDLTEAVQGPVVVIGLHHPDERELGGVLCTLETSKRGVEIPLSQLLLDAEDPNGEMIEDYRYWIWDYQDRISEDELMLFDDEESGDEDDDFEEEGDDWDDSDEDWDDEDDWEDEDFQDDFPSGSLYGGESAPVEFPIGTVAYYGPDDKRTTKIVAGIVWSRDGEPLLKRWVGSEVTTSDKVQREIVAFFEQHGVRSIIATDGNIGCPHEEGQDFPPGEDCPFCPWWKGKQGTGRRD